MGKKKGNLAENFQTHDAMRQTKGFGWPLGFKNPNVDALHNSSAMEQRSISIALLGTFFNKAGEGMISFVMNRPWKLALKEFDRQNTSQTRVFNFPHPYSHNPIRDCLLIPHTTQSIQNLTTQQIDCSIPFKLLRTQNWKSLVGC